MPLHFKLITTPTYYSAIAHIRQRAFSSNPFNICLYGQVSPAVLEDWFVEREKRDSVNPSQRIVAVMNEEERILAYAKWEVPANCMSDFPGMVEYESGNEAVGIPKLPVGADAELFARFRGGIDGMRERYSDHREDFCMCSACSPFPNI